MALRLLHRDFGIVQGILDELISAPSSSSSSMRRRSTDGASLRAIASSHVETRDRDSNRPAWRLLGPPRQQATRVELIINMKAAGSEARSRFVGRTQSKPREQTDRSAS